MSIALDASFRSTSALSSQYVESSRLRDPNKAQGPDIVESISDSIRSNLQAADEVRPLIEEWVQEEARRHDGSRMAAYGAVARLFKCSESWVRRMLGRQITRFDADLYKRILASEPRLQARRVAEAKALLEGTACLRERIDETVQCDHGGAVAGGETPFGRSRAPQGEGQ